MKRLLLIALMFSFSAFIYISCKKDKGDPPILPPYESMAIDFSNFTSQKRSAGVNEEVKGTESSTWQFAAAVAGVWNTLISSSIAVPLAAYDSASNVNPGYVSENLWQWTYDFTFEGVPYKSKLSGQISTNSVVWQMHVTKDISGGFTDFLWIEGTSATDGSGGQWIFHESPVSPAGIFQDDWTKSGTVVTTVKYTYIKDDENKGSYINYLIPSASSFDLGYNIHFSSGIYSDSDIEWNKTTRDGRLKSVDYLQDDNWYCWDTNKINKVCD
jgi:hypothetical protein